MSKKNILYLFVLIFLLFTLSILFFSKEKEGENEKKIKVITTIFPLYDIAKNVGGDEVEVSMLLDPGLEAHSFEPTPNDMIEINKADIFIYTGPFMEIWAERVISAADNPNILVISASESIELLEEEDEPGHKHEEGDPHIWLDFDNLKIMLENIKDGFLEKGLNEENVQKRANEYEKAINDIDEAYFQYLSNCKTRTLVYGGHYAFAYLTKRYNLSYQSAYGLSPNSEPSALKLTELTEQIKDNNLKYIFHEELLNPRLSETLRQETGVKILNLSAAHNLSREDLDANKSLFQVLLENLKSLQTGLECY